MQRALVVSFLVVLTLAPSLPVAADEAASAHACRVAGCLAWTNTLSTTLDDRAMPSAVAIDRSMVFVGYNALDFNSNLNPLPVKRTVRGYDAATGEMRWENVFDAVPVSGRWLEALATGNDTSHVYLVSRTTSNAWEVKALRASDGGLAWAQTFSTGGSSIQIRVVDQRVHVLANDLRLRAFNATTGGLVHDRAAAVGSYNVGFAATSARVYLYAEKFVDGTFQQHLYAYNATTGAAAWTKQIGTPSSQWRDINYAVVAAPGRVVALNAVGGRLVSYREDGTLEWDRAIMRSAPYSAALTNDALVLGLGASVHRLALDGSTIWAASAPSGAQQVGLTPDARVFAAAEGWLALWNADGTPGFTTTKAGGAVDYSSPAGLAVNRVNIATPGMRGDALVETYVVQVPATAPRDLAAAPGPRGGEITLTWTPPESFGDTPHTGYRIRYDSSAILLPASATSYTDATLAPGQTRTYALEATTGMGAGASANVTATAWDLPDAPTNVTARVGPEAWSIVVAWTPADAGGTPHTAFAIERAEPGSSSFVEIARVPPGTSHLDADLAPGAYNYRIRGVNLVGAGEASAPTCNAGLAPLPIGVPDAPAAPC